jgi:hypothetical protein
MFLMDYKKHIFNNLYPNFNLVGQFGVRSIFLAFALFCTHLFH